MHRLQGDGLMRFRRRLALLGCLVVAVGLIGGCGRDEIDRGDVPNNAPVAQDLQVFTDEDNATSFILAASDRDGDALTYERLTAPASGSLSGDVPSFTYTPGANYYGTDRFTYVASDGQLLSKVATVSITIASVNDAPVATDGSAITPEDQALTIALSASDADADDTLTYTAGNPTNGTLGPIVGNTVTYTPNANFNGSDGFTFSAHDGAAGSNSASISITVNPVNDPPSAAAAAIATAEDTPSAAVAPTVTDPDDAAHTISIATQPANGTATVESDRLVYTPKPNFNGGDSFKFTATDSGGASITGTASVTVTPANDAPLATSRLASTLEDTPVQIALGASDVDGDTLQYVIVSLPNNGGISDQTGNALTYTPNPNYSGNDSFTFRVNDGTLDSNVAGVTLTITAVNDAPVAVNGSALTSEETAVSVTLSATDAENDALTYTIVALPSGGILSGTLPELTYTPIQNFSGSDSFTFRASDSEDGNVATFTIIVNAINDVPVANARSVTATEDTPKSITLTGSDVDSSVLTFTAQPTSTQGGTVACTGSACTYTPPTDFSGADSFSFTVSDDATPPATSTAATVSITVAAVNDAPVADDLAVTTDEDTAKSITLTASDADGDTLSYAAQAASLQGGAVSCTGAACTYTPPANYSGADSFTFTASDGASTSNLATVSISVDPVNDPPAASALLISTVQDTNRAFTLSGSDIDSATLTFDTPLTTANAGTLACTGAACTYTPPAGFVGSDSFTFTVSDDATPPAESAAATVSIIVTATPNNAPVAENQAVTTDEDTPRAITLAAGDADTEDTLSFQVGASASGSLSGTPPNLTYTPFLHFYGADSFTFTASDGKDTSNLATVSITVNAVNDAPVANAQSVTATEDTAKSITLSGNDVETTVLTFTAQSASAQGGTVACTGAACAYTPAENFNGADSFTFTVSDDAVPPATSAPATVSISVAAVNDAPVADDQAVAAVEDTAKSITLIANDADAGDTLSYAAQAASLQGGAVSCTGAACTYTPPADYSGADSFTFTASDAASTSNVATVSITVTAVNDTPVANPQSRTTAEDTPKPITLTGSDLDSSVLTFTVQPASAQGGTVACTGAACTYTPAENFNGADSFNFTVSDDAVPPATSAPATVSITVTAVNDTPMANDQALTTPEDTPVSFTLTGSDVDAGDTLTFQVGTPASGSLSGTPPNLTYTPNLHSNGADSFTFTVTDSATPAATSPAATVSITVTAVNDAPVANAGSNQDVGVGTAVTLDGSGSSDVDIADVLTYAWSQTLGPAVSLDTTDPARPTFTAPDVATSGTLTFQLVVNDGTVNSAPDSVSVTVNDNLAPANVSGFTATPGDQQILLEWSNPAASDFAGVLILRKTGSAPSGPGDATATTVYDGTGTIILDGGLTNGSTYYYTAYARDEVPNYASGAALSAVPAIPATPPGAPQRLIASGGDATVTLTWQAPTTGDAPAGYKVFRATASPVSTAETPNATVAAGTLTYSDTTLANLTTYYYRVVAYNAGGASPDSNENDATPHVQEGGTWTARASMPTAKWYAAASEVKGRIYVIGGNGNGQYTGTVDEYNPATNTWTNCGTGCEPMAITRWGHTSSEVNGKIYVFGGYTGGTTGILDGSVEEYDPIANTWTPRLSMPARAHSTSSAVNGKIYVIGGTSGTLVEEYNPASNSWPNCGGGCAAMPTARNVATSSVVNGKIYVIGGSAGGSTALNTVEEYDPATNTWTNCGGTCAAMPTARSLATSRTINGRIYVVGGYNDIGPPYFSTVEVYDPAINAWSTMVSIPTERIGLVSGTVNGKLYVVGGLAAGDIALATVEEFTPPPLQPEDGWATKAPMPTARQDLTSSVVNGKIYAIGGLTSVYSNAVEEYDPVTNSWTSKAPMPTARYGPASGVTNGKVYVIGGNAGSDLGTVEEYNPPTNSWTNCAPYPNCAPMPTARRRPTASVVNGKIYVIGGITGSTHLTTVEEYDPATNTWTNCGITAPGNGCDTMTTARQGLASSVVNGRIYAIGGKNQPVTTLDTIEEFDPVTHTWTNCGSSCPTMPSTRGFTTSSEANGKIYVFGGEALGSTQVNTVEEFDPVWRTWKPVTSMPTARGYLTSSVLNGRIFAIGGNSGTEQLKTVEAYTPPGAEPSANWTAMDASESHTVAIRSDGTLWAWGRSDSGQLGLGNSTGPETCGTIPCSTVPMRVGADTDWVAVAAGGMYSLALKSNGTLWAWGANWSGQLGLGTTGPETCTYGSLACRATPVQVGTDADWVAVATGWMHSLALKSNGTLWAWGSNDIGELGQGTESGPETCTFSGKSQACSTTPLQVGADVDWAIVDAAGSSHSMAIKTSGTLWAWGYNARSELGFASSGTCSWPAQNEDSPCTKSPTQVGTDTNWAEVVAANGDHTHAVKTTGTLWAWGNNNYGQLGLGTNTGPENCGPYGTACSTIPRQVGADTGWSGIAAGGGLSIARKIDGTLWAAGADYLGQLGTTTTETCDSPGDPSVPCSTILIQVDVDADWAAVAVGSAHSLALRTDGTLWAWGGNSLGQLGLGDTANRDVPTQVVVP